MLFPNLQSKNKSKILIIDCRKKIYGLNEKNNLIKNLNLTDYDCIYSTNTYQQFVIKNIKYIPSKFTFNNVFDKIIIAGNINMISQINRTIHRKCCFYITSINDISIFQSQYINFYKMIDTVIFDNNYLYNIFNKQKNNNTLNKYILPHITDILYKCFPNIIKKKEYNILYRFVCYKELNIIQKIFTYIITKYPFVKLHIINNSKKTQILLSSNKQHTIIHNDPSELNLLDIFKKSLIYLNIGNTKNIEEIYNIISCGCYIIYLKNDVIKEATSNFGTIINIEGKSKNKIYENMINNIFNIIIKFQENNKYLINHLTNQINTKNIKLKI